MTLKIKNITPNPEVKMIFFKDTTNASKKIDFSELDQTPVLVQAWAKVDGGKTAVAVTGISEKVVTFASANTEIIGTIILED